MNAFALTLVVGATFFAPQTSMDTSIGGKSVEQYHDSSWDPNLKLYLYSGGD